MSEKASLQDVINYRPDQYYTDDEISLIRSTFKDNPRLIQVLRKALLPTFADPAMPIEELGNDVWLVSRSWDQIPQDEVKALIVARQEAIKFIAGALIALQVTANQREMTPMEKAAKDAADSVK
jgi:hypothetical protein